MRMLTIKLINGKTFQLPSKNVHKGDRCTRLNLAGGRKIFANWYIISAE